MTRAPPSVSKYCLLWEYHTRQGGLVPNRHRGLWPICISPRALRDCKSKTLPSGLLIQMAVYGLKLRPPSDPRAFPYDFSSTQMACQRRDRRRRGWHPLDGSGGSSRPARRGLPDAGRGGHICLWRRLGTVHHPLISPRPFAPPRPEPGRSGPAERRAPAAATGASTGPHRHRSPASARSAAPPRRGA